MPEPTPSGLALIISPTTTTVSWTNEDNYAEVGPMVSGTTTSHDDNDIIVYNSPARYAVKAYLPPFDPSELSAEVSYTRTAHAATTTDTVVATDSATAALTSGGTAISTATVSDSVTVVSGFSVTATATATATDLAQSGQSIRTDFAPYWGTEDGYVHKTAPDILSDNGTSITSSWTSKTIDFAEDNVDNTGKWKTIYKFEYLYKEDDTDVPTVFSISSNGGATWATQSKNLGTAGDGRIEHAHFFWNKTGQFFVVKIEWPSTDKAFQFLGFDIVYDDQGDQFEVV
jgi:hypothetical protein